jgi:hypothetical protein
LKQKPTRKNQFLASEIGSQKPMTHDHENAIIGCEMKSFLKGVPVGVAGLVFRR